MPPKFAAKPSNIFYPRFGEVSHETFITDEDITPEDKKIVESSFPADQKKLIHYAKPAVLRYNTELEFNGIIACSPHFIGIFRRDPQTKKAVKSAVFHIFEISSMKIKSPTKILIFCRLPELKKANPIVNCRIVNATALRFSQIVRRNYMISTCAFKPDELCDFRATNMKDFPNFIHDLSISQQYQMTYYAFATRMQVKYNHEISEFYHDKIKYEDGIYDFGMLPDDISQTEMEPAILALNYFPYIHGLILHHKKMEWIANSIAPLVERSSNLKFIHFEGCGIETGVGEIGSRILNNPKIPISYINFSHNPVSTRDGGCEKVFEALKVIRHPMFYINFGCCQAQSVKTLFEALRDNENLWHVKYLFFNGNYTDWEDAKILCKHFQNLHERGIMEITTLGIGGAANCISDILKGLEQFPQPITYLSFEGTRMELSSTKALLHYIQQSTCLKVLDLSYSAMDPNLTADVILEMSKFERTKEISIKLNGNDLNRVKLMSIAKGFLYSDLNMWTSIALGSNGMSTNDLDFLISFLWRMPNLRELDLSGNFTKENSDISRILAKISTGFLPNLKHLKIGGRQNGIGTLMFDFLDGCKNYNDLEIFDISNNSFGEYGLQRLEAILKANPKIHTLFMDVNRPYSLNSLQRVLDYIYSNENITFFPFPYFDAISAVRACKSSEEAYAAKTRVKAMRHECLRQINIHRKHAGMPMMLPFEAVPELGDLVEEIKDSMHQMLLSCVTRVHNGVCRDMGVTLPYLSAGEPIEHGGTVEKVDIGEMVKYHSKDMEIRIHEQLDYELMGEPVGDASPTVEEEEEEEEEEEKHDPPKEEDKPKPPPPSSSSSSDEEEEEEEEEEEKKPSLIGDEKDPAKIKFKLVTKSSTFHIKRTPSTAKTSKINNSSSESDSDI